MSTKPLERLMFAQGGFCFFCNKLLPKAEASVEHLVPSARSGSNHDDNCVACCKSLNSLLGSMSLKEKIKVVLNQKGDFKCPNGMTSLAAEIASQLDIISTTALAPSEAVSSVIISEASPSPAHIAKTAKPQPAAKTSPLAMAQPKTTTSQQPKDILASVIKDLNKRGKSKPLRVKTLTSTIKAMPLKLSDQQIQTVLEQLKAKGKIVVTGAKVAYKP